MSPPDFLFLADLTFPFKIYSTVNVKMHNILSVTVFIFLILNNFYIICIFLFI